MKVFKSLPTGFKRMGILWVNRYCVYLYSLKCNPKLLYETDVNSPNLVSRQVTCFVRFAFLKELARAGVCGLVLLQVRLVGWFYCWGISVTETFRSYVSQLY